MDRAHLTRRERRKLEVRTRIVEAAVALFDRQGVAETKVAEICERADVAHKTFFNHFPSRQHLLRAIATTSIEQLLVDIEDARKQPVSTRERLRLLLRADRGQTPTRRGRPTASC